MPQLAPEGSTAAELAALPPDLRVKLLALDRKLKEGAVSKDEYVSFMSRPIPTSPQL